MDQNRNFRSNIRDQIIYQSRRNPEIDLGNLTNLGPKSGVGLGNIQMRTEREREEIMQ